MLDSNEEKVDSGSFLVDKTLNTKILRQARFDRKFLTSAAVLQFQIPLDHRIVIGVEAKWTPDISVCEKRLKHGFQSHVARILLQLATIIKKLIHRFISAFI